MSETNLSPTPWRAGSIDVVNLETSVKGKFHWVENAEGLVVCSITKPVVNPEIHARLIAVAPEMLVELRSARATLADYLAATPGVNPAADLLRGQIQGIDAVIAKAEGRSE